MHHLPLPMRNEPAATHIGTPGGMTAGKPAGREAFWKHRRLGFTSIPTAAVGACPPDQPPGATLELHECLDQRTAHPVTGTGRRKEAALPASPRPRCCA